MKRLNLIIFAFVFFSCKKVTTLNSSKLSLNGKWYFNSTTLFGYDKYKTLGPLTSKYPAGDYLNITNETTWHYEIHPAYYGYNIISDSINNLVIEFPNTSAQYTFNFNKINDTLYYKKYLTSDTIQIKQLSSNLLVLYTKTKSNLHPTTGIEIIDSLKK